MDCHKCECQTGPNNLCVSKVPIFNQLTNEELREISKLTFQRKFRKKEIILRAEERPDHLYIIHKGGVKIYRLTAAGKEQLVRVLKAGDFMGELSLFTREESPSFAETLEETEICMISRRDMHDLVVKYPSISLKILEEISTRLNQTEMLLEEVNVEDVERRVASYLVKLVQSRTSHPSADMKKIVLPLSKQDLASLIGMSRETLSRKLSLFQQRGWIRQSGQRTITILNYKSLEKTAGGDAVVA